MKLKDTAEARPPRLVLYGPFGQGKTAFVETLGEGLELLDTDDGAASGLNLKDNFYEHRRNVEVQKFTKYEDLKARVQAIATACNNGTYPYKAVALDSLTTTADMILKWVLRNNGNALGPPTLPQWGMAISEVEQLLTTLRALPVVVAVLAHEDTEEIDGINMKVISIYGKKLNQKIPCLFDEVLYVKVRMVANLPQYALQTMATVSVPARSRHQSPNGFLLTEGMPKFLAAGGFNWATFNPFPKKGETPTVPKP